MSPKVLLLACAALLACSSAQSSDFLADRHAKMGLSCESCHGTGDAKIDQPGIDQCTVCHDTQKLVETTKHVKPKNPHTSPHYQDRLDCVNCHYGHEKSENFCAQCHKFDFKVP